jgi:hypothetical protein
MYFTDVEIARKLNDLKGQLEGIYGVAYKVELVRKQMGQRVHHYEVVAVEAPEPGPVPEPA